MEERRRFERFQLRLPVRMEVISSGKRQIFDLETKDISAAGVFIETSERFSKGTPVRLSMTLSSSRIQELTGSQSLIKVKGIVARSDPTGLAVSFVDRHTAGRLMGRSGHGLQRNTPRTSWFSVALICGRASLFFAWMRRCTPGPPMGKYTQPQPGVSHLNRAVIPVSRCSIRLRRNPRR